MTEQPAGSSVSQARALKATKIRACASCGAPGVYVTPLTPSEIEHYGRWPAVVVGYTDERRGTSVGETCPCCGSSRVGLLEKLGTIWRGVVPADRTVKGA